MEIRYLTYRQIDKTKWDDCIDNAPNGLIYAYSFYLDTMSENWDALVVNDYEIIMPLTWNRKYGISYLYQPAFTACLGIFGRSVSPEMVHAFLKAIPTGFRYWDIYLNAGNQFKVADFDLYERMNFVLTLDQTYDNLYLHYRENIKRNIKKSEQLELTINKNIKVTEVIKLASQQARGSYSIKKTDYARFVNLYDILYKKQKATAYGVYTQKDQLIASAVFFFSHNRAYYILVGNHPDGKTLGASHALINAFIKDHAGEHLILDFEGSDISSLAFFYSSFGASVEKYPAIRLNKLPAPLKWLKK